MRSRRSKRWPTGPPQRSTALDELESGPSRTPVSGSIPGSSVVSIVEDVTGGPGRLIPRAARQLLITPRNTERRQCHDLQHLTSRNPGPVMRTITHPVAGHLPAERLKMTRQVW